MFGRNMSGRECCFWHFIERKISTATLKGRKCCKYLACQLFTVLGMTWWQLMLYHFAIMYVGFNSLYLKSFLPLVTPCGSYHVSDVRSILFAPLFVSLFCRWGTNGCLCVCVYVQTVAWRAWRWSSLPTSLASRTWRRWQMTWHCNLGWRAIACTISTMTRTLWRDSGRLQAMRLPTGRNHMHCFHHHSVIDCWSLKNQWHSCPRHTGAIN